MLLCVLTYLVMVSSVAVAVVEEVMAYVAVASLVVGFLTRPEMAQLAAEAGEVVAVEVARSCSEG